MLPFQLRPYRPADCASLAALFYDTVHTVNAKDYTPSLTRGRMEMSIRMHGTLLFFPIRRMWRCCRMRIRMRPEMATEMTNIMAMTKIAATLAERRTVMAMTWRRGSSVLAIWMHQGIWTGSTFIKIIRDRASPPRSATGWKRKYKQTPSPPTLPSPRDLFLRKGDIRW